MLTLNPYPSVWSGSLLDYRLYIPLDLLLNHSLKHLQEKHLVVFFAVLVSYVTSASPYLSLAQAH